MALQSAADRLGVTLEAIAKACRNARSAFDQNDVEKFADTVFEISKSSDGVSRKIAVLNDTSAAWVTGAQDILDETLVESVTYLQDQFVGKDRSTCNPKEDKEYIN
jgi:hypothetical protein